MEVMKERFPAQAKKELSRWPKLPPDGMNWPALHCREFPVKGGGMRGQVGRSPGRLAVLCPLGHWTG